MGDHYYYEKVLSTGEILKTKVSHFLFQRNTTTYLQRHIKKATENNFGRIQCKQLILYKYLRHSEFCRETTGQDGYF